MRVAILEDEISFREALAAALDRHHHEIAVAAGSAEGLFAALATAPIDVIILDLRIETVDGIAVGDGLSTLTTLKEVYPETPVVVLSSSRDQATIEECLRRGAAGFLGKQSSGLKEIGEAVSAAAAGHRFFPTPVLSASLDAEPRRDSPLSQLTLRERQVLEHIAVGDDNLKIAAALQISERTVRAHVSGIYRKLGSENRAQLAILARQLGVRSRSPATSVAT